MKDWVAVIECSIDMVMMNSVASCSGIDFLPYTTIMQAKKLIRTSMVIRSQCSGAHRLINSVTKLHSSTDALISLNLWRSGLGMSISAVHSAPIHTVIAVCRSVNCSEIRVTPTRPAAKRSPR